MYLATGLAVGSVIVLLVQGLLHLIEQRREQAGREPGSG